eukprot:1035627-Rhodomonas_salina.2
MRGHANSSSKYHTAKVIVHGTHWSRVPGYPGAAGPRCSRGLRLLPVDSDDRDNRLRRGTVTVTKLPVNAALG